MQIALSTVTPTSSRQAPLSSHLENMLSLRGLKNNVVLRWEKPGFELRQPLPSLPFKFLPMGNPSLSYPLPQFPEEAQPPNKTAAEYPGWIQTGSGARSTWRCSPQPLSAPHRSLQDTSRLLRAGPPKSVGTDFPAQTSLAIPTAMPMPEATATWPALLPCTEDTHLPPA